MGKYGSGVSMKTVIELEVREVEGILDYYKLPQEEKAQVIDALKEMAYQWCSSNATACALEDAVMKFCNDETAQNVLREAVAGGVREHQFAATYPFE